jgi:hypothetical protein
MAAARCAQSAHVIGVTRRPSAELPGVMRRVNVRR